MLKFTFLIIHFHRDVIMFLLLSIMFKSGKKEERAWNAVARRGLLVEERGLMFVGVPPDVRVAVAHGVERLREGALATVAPPHVLPVADSQ